MILTDPENKSGAEFLPGSSRGCPLIRSVGVAEKLDHSDPRRSRCRKIRGWRPAWGFGFTPKSWGCDESRRSEPRRVPRRT